MKRKQRKRRGFYLLRPGSLQKQVDLYGYRFSWKNQAAVTGCVLASLAAVGFLYKLSWPCMAAVLAAMMLMLPGLILDTYKRMYEQKRFSDVVTYIEQLMYSFRKNGKIKLALLECREAFSDGAMKDTIEKAVSYINRGEAMSEKGVLKEALELIETPYRCRRIHTAHELLINAETDGGEVENSITLILKDNESWKRRVYKLQADKKKSHTNNIISIAVATLLCALCLYVIDYMRVMFHSAGAVDVFHHTFVQASSALFILFSMYAYKKSSGSMTDDWVGEQEDLYDNEKIRDTYREVRAYDREKAVKRSMILAAPFFTAAAVLFFVFHSWSGIPLFLFAVFLLLQHKIGHSLAGKDLEHAVQAAFPQWLMEMALLLQNNNVQVSIMKSAKRAPAVLAPELSALALRMEEDPEQLSTYIKFCEGFRLPEAQSCMKMLYSISESGVGDAKVQIHNLLGQMNKMQEQADSLTAENALFKMHMIFSYPVFAAAVKMLVDMTIGMFVMFQIMGSVGGL